MGCRGRGDGPPPRSVRRRDRRSRRHHGSYDATLLRYPNLSRALLGSARATQQAGDVVTAGERYATLAAQWKDADPAVPELDEVRTGARAQRTSQR